MMAPMDYDTGGPISSSNDAMTASDTTSSSSVGDPQLPITPEPRKHVVFVTDGDLSEVDLERGTLTGDPQQPSLFASRSYNKSPGTSPSPRVRDQSKRLSKLMMQQTELHLLTDHHNAHTSPTPENHVAQEEEESAGLRYWWNEMETAQEHGGDYQVRLDMALRAALGSLLCFSVLVFPHQQILGAVWIGNIFFHANLKDSLGACVVSVWDFGNSIVLTSLVSFPIATFLDTLSTLHAAILLPVVVFAMTFFIMTCPQLAGRNLMILVMYIIVATVVREEIEWWEPLGWTATYLIGLAIAVLANLLPHPNAALKTFHVQLNRLEKDFTMLLRQSKHYAENASATNLAESRAAIASIEMLHTRVTQTVKILKTKLPAAQIELHMTCRSAAANDLTEWVLQAEKLLTPLKSVRTGLTQRVLGEDFHIQSPALRQAKGMINDEIAASRDRLIDAMIASIAVCHAWADPSTRRVVLPDVHEELESALRDCRRRFHRTMAKAAAILHQQNGSTENGGVASNGQQNSNMNLFAHLTRRMSAFNGLFELAESLSQYLNRHNWETQEIKGRGPAIRPCQWAYSCLYSTHSYMEKKWLWHSPDNFRLALKTSVGMFLASLFVSVPYLWEIASPFGVWPGLTIASVNLADTGSSFHKASDRLFGTLLAAAYALLVTDLFPGNLDTCKIPAIALFTFGVIYLKDSQHAYKYTYAATSIGSMLYGSVKNDFNIAGYIPKRIELIFTGVVIFTFVELLLFPRSSRRMVEKLSLKFFPVLQDFTNQATICAQRMKTFIADSKEHTDYVEALLGDHEDPFQLEKLTALHGEMKSLSNKLKKELDSGLDEPHVGFSLKLNPKAFRGLSRQIADCEVQAILILKSFQTLARYYRNERHPLRHTAWPELHAEILRDIARVSGTCRDKLVAAYPDGRLRPQGGNAVRAVIAASSLREFQDVRLRALAGWSDIYASTIESSAVVHVPGDASTTSDDEEIDPVSIMTISITTTMILDLCRSIQLAGKHVEDIAHTFPASK